MKKIMFIMTKLGGIGWGGAHKVSVMLANYLAQKGYEVSFSVSELDRVDYPVDESIKVFCLKDLYKKSSFRPMNLVKKMKAFRGLCKEENIDLVVGFTSNMAIYSILASVFSSRKSLVSERTDPHIEPNKKILRGLRNFLFCLADFVVFQTPGARDYFPKKVRKKSIIIPNPISETLPEAYHGEREKRVVNYCRIAPQKNLRVLLDAFDLFYKKHKDYSLEIYGDAKQGDKYKTEIEEYAKTLSCCENIHFFPACKDVHQKVINSTMFVSSSDYEGMSNSMLEALAIGLPVIVTDCANGGERMCIEDGKSGFIVPRRNAECLAENMSRLVDEKNLIDLFSNEAAKIRDRFSHEKVFAMWLEVVEKL